MNSLVLKSKDFDNESICHKQIHGPYWNANYGGLDVVIHKTVGYINVTQLCKANGKQFGNWHRNKSTKAMITELSAKLGNVGVTIPPEHMLVTVEGGSGEHKKLICGTYAHPILLSHK